MQALRDRAFALLERRVEEIFQKFARVKARPKDFPLGAI
jgi:hypothetical protein